MRCRLQINGVVQGVGFRPFVYTLAARLGLAGFVGNNAQGVFLEIQGDPEALQQCVRELRDNPPPLAQIASITQETIADVPDSSSFAILHSDRQASGTAWISPDIATCDDCLREMQDPANRRYRYPFINCTHCGPRFTITLQTPYDRSSTTMASFRMCTNCQAEYDSPLDRRFHAQPNACPSCGPHLTWVMAGEPHLHHDDALLAAQQALRAGHTVAIKGLGGFHLAVDATNHKAVLRLRERKHRYGKPLAVMVADTEAARQIAHLNTAEEQLLISRERPIVLLHARKNHLLSPAIAPGTSETGIMLPYSGMHTLLMQGLGPLVLTSGNLSQQPIVWQNDTALASLVGIADGFLLHNRAIHVPCDDSVVRVIDQQESPIRRSRGYAPLPVALPSTLSGTHRSSVLAAGAELKSTFCLTRGDSAFLSQHLGDMESYETLTALEQSVQHVTGIFHIRPNAVACDLHPGYLSSQWAARYAAHHHLPLLRVQHHHAHLAAAMTEHGLDGKEPVLGIIFDGTGYGTDGTIWGGEFLVGDYASFHRHLRLRPIPLPGGDGAVRHPYRTALAAMYDAEIAWDETLAVVRETPLEERNLLLQQLQRRLNVTASSSMGRLFDAVAAMLGQQRSVQFEAQAAIQLEAISVSPDSFGPYPFHIEETTTNELSSRPLQQIDTRPLVQAIVNDVRQGVPASIIAARFHRTVQQMTLDAAQHIHHATGVRTVVLSGGVWQNRILATHIPPALRQLGFKVLEHHRVPSNDGGLALGQAIVAMAQYTPRPQCCWPTETPSTWD